MDIFLKFEGEEHIVNDYYVNLSSPGEGPRNATPGNIRLSILVKPQKNPLAKIYAFAKEQHDQSKSKGKGQIVVFKEKGVGEALQTIDFSGAWVESFSIQGQKGNDNFEFELEIESSKIAISGVDYEDKHKEDLVNGD